MTRSAVIVGAGVGGLTCAVGLRAAGWTVHVLERAPEVVRDGAGFGLWPNAQSALERIGLLEHVQRIGLPYRQASIRTPAGRRLADLPLGRIERQGGCPVILLPRPALMDVLISALDGVTLSTGHTIDHPDTLRADYDVVIGADGLRSGIRAAFFGARSAPRYAGFTAWRGTVDFEVSEHGEIWGSGLFVGATPISRGHTNWYAAFSAPEGSTGSMASLCARTDGWPDPVPRILEAVDDRTVLRHDVHDLAPRLPSFVAGSAALIGDAAHAMTPSLGQGACQAMLDATTLAECLASADAPADGLQAYDRQRRRVAQRLAAASALLSRMQLTGHFTPLRDAALRASSSLLPA